MLVTHKDDDHRSSMMDDLMPYHLYLYFTPRYLFPDRRRMWAVVCVVVEGGKRRIRGNWRQTRKKGNWELLDL